MFLLFELVMRYCDYETFKTCSTLNKECNRICKKLLPQLKKIKKEKDKYYETYWKNQKQGLSYYTNDTSLQVIDYNDGKIVAGFYYYFVSEYFEFDLRRYIVKLDLESKQIIIPKITGYPRRSISLKPIENYSFFI